MENQENQNNIEDLCSEQEMSLYFNILNIFQSYYKNLYNKFNESSMFDEIDYSDETSTSRSMELFYEFMDEYRVNKSKNITLIEIYEDDTIDVNQFENIYGLIIDNKLSKLSPSFFSLLIYLNELEWDKIDWKITKIKGEF